MLESVEVFKIRHSRIKFFKQNSLINLRSWRLHLGKKAKRIKRSHKKTTLKTNTFITGDRLYKKYKNESEGHD